MAKNYSVNQATKTITVDFEKLTVAEQKAVETMIKCGYALEIKRKMSAATKQKIVSPKAIYTFLTNPDNKSEYHKELATQWESWKKEFVSYTDKKTNEIRTRRGGDMHARKKLKETAPDAYADIIKAILDARA